MKKTMDVIIRFIVIARMLSVSLGSSFCECNCDLKEYGVEDICNSVARATSKADTNEEAITALIGSYNREILPFIRKHGSLRHSTTTSTTPKTDVNAPAVDFLEELEKVKKQFESEQRRLEGKIEILEKRCLEAVETRTSTMEQEFAAKADVVESKILKVKDEVLEKINETADGTLQMNNEVSKRVAEVEENTLKKISELVMQVEKEDSELKEKLNAEQADRSHLEKMLNGTRDKLGNLEVAQNEIAIALIEQINITIEDLKVQVDKLEHFEVDRRLDDLETEGDRRNKTLTDLQETIENYTQVENRVSLYKEIFGVLFDTFQAMEQQVLPTVQEFKEKSAHVEEVFRHLCSENVSRASSAMSFTMTTVEGDQQHMSSTSTESVTSVQNEVKECNPVYEIPIWNRTEATAKTCDTPQNYSEINSVALLKGPLGFEKCGDVMLLDGSVKGSNKRTEACKGNPSQFLLLVKRKLKDEEEFKSICWAVMLNSKWAMAAGHLFHPGAMYRVQGQTAAGWIFEIEVKSAYYIPGTLLLHLPTSTPFSTSTNFSPPCLLGEEGADELLGPAIFLGWDNLQKYQGFPRASLHIAEVCLISDPECRTAYGNSDFRSYVLCAENDEQVRELCEGTADGFLFKKMEDKEVLIGIRHSSIKDKPFQFWELSHYTDYINSIVKKYL